jgi:hypothetical protein
VTSENQPGRRSGSHDGEPVDIHQKEHRHSISRIDY